MVKFSGVVVNKILGLFGLRLSRISQQVSYGDGLAFRNVDLTFEKTPGFSLILIGAHNGIKTESLVRAAAEYGKVCLVEPVPHLFAELEARYSNADNIVLLNKCVTAEKLESVDFYSPNKNANSLESYGDQLGSMNSEHAINHNSGFATFIEKIRVPAVSIEQLFVDLDCRYVSTVLVDTEGFDSDILSAFPYEKVVAPRIVFEHKHSDGTYTVGRKFAHLLALMSENGYRVQILDAENCMASKLYGLKGVDSV